MECHHWFWFHLGQGSGGKWIPLSTIIASISSEWRIKLFTLSDLGYSFSKTECILLRIRKAFGMNFFGSSYSKNNKQSRDFGGILLLFKSKINLVLKITFSGDFQYPADHTGCPKNVKYLKNHQNLNTLSWKLRSWKYLYVHFCHDQINFSHITVYRVLKWHRFYGNLCFYKLAGFQAYCTIIRTVIKMDFSSRITT